jgi:hypothetical protein
MKFVYENVEGMLRGMARAMCRGIAYPIIDLQMFYKEHSLTVVTRLTHGCLLVGYRKPVNGLKV